MVDKAEKKIRQVPAVQPAGPPANDLEIRKTNEAIGLKVSKGKLTFLTRKLFSVMILHAQKLGAHGVNDPINDETSSQYFWAPFAELVKDSDYNSRDTALFKELVDEMQDVRLQSESSVAWTAERLLSSVRIANPAGLNKRGGKLWVGYSFPPNVHQLVLNPKVYTKISLYYLTILRTGAGIALYEIARKFSWRTTGLTDVLPWEDWRDILEGMPASDMADWKHEYKYFKSRVLNKAIEEVNTLTDLQVELIEVKAGRKVNGIQFRITQTMQGSLALPPAPVIDGQLLDRIEALGISRREAEDTLGAHDEAFLRSSLDVVEARVHNATLPAIKSSAAFLRSALRDRYADGAKKPRQSPALPKPEIAKSDERPANPELEERVRQALESFDALDEPTKALTVKAFQSAMPSLRRLRVEGVPFRKAMANWMLVQEANTIDL